MDESIPDAEVSIPDAEVSIENYVLHRHDRSRTGGGVCVYIYYTKRYVII